MLFCGTQDNIWVELALQYLPDDIFGKINGKVAFTCLKSDACRLGSKICKHKEIIILSPWIFQFRCESDKEARYFIFCVLHEVAHVVLPHMPPDQLQCQDNQRQETEADELALKWFNSYALKVDDKEILPLCIEEIEMQKDQNQRRLESFLSYG